MLRGLNDRGSLAARRLFGAVLLGVLALRLLAPGLPAATPGTVALCTGSGVVLLATDPAAPDTGAPDTEAPERLPCPAFHLAAALLPAAPAPVALGTLVPADRLAAAGIAPVPAPRRDHAPPRGPPSLSA